MMISLAVLFATTFGAVLGSFAGAQMWRLRARQLVQDKARGEAYDKAEYKRLVGLTKGKLRHDHSRCLSCSHTLAWYDLAPLVSWLSTNGRCRYCKQPIGRFEPLIEIGTAGLFALFSYAWLTTFGVGAVALGILALWLAALTMLVILFVYDLKWFLLPDVIMFPLIGLSFVITALTIVVFKQPEAAILLLSMASSIMILGGLYLVLWLISKGGWVGFGDVKLGVALGTLLIDWKLALMTLFLANLIGTLIVLPGLLSGKLSRKTQVPFGPFLIGGFVISIVAGQALLDGYTTFMTWLSMTTLML